MRRRKLRTIDNYRPILEKMRECDLAMGELDQAYGVGSGVRRMTSGVRSLLADLAQLLPDREAHGYFKAPGERWHSTSSGRPS